MARRLPKAVTSQRAGAAGTNAHLLFPCPSQVALFAEGFANDNSIACVNLCRDEVTHALKHKVGGCWWLAHV